MPNPAASQRRRLPHDGLAAFFLLAGTAIFVLWRFPPDRNAFYTACPIHQYLHLLCPGCGSTRAIAALLHGQVREALRWNALLLLVELPLAALYAAVACRRALREEFFRWPRPPLPAAYAAVGAVAIFTVLRNL